MKKPLLALALSIGILASGSAFAAPQKGGHGPHNNRPQIHQPSRQAYRPQPNRHRQPTRVVHHRPAHQPVRVVHHYQQPTHVTYYKESHHRDHVTTAAVLGLLGGAMIVAAIAN